jgi:hypothetical protein
MTALRIAFAPQKKTARRNGLCRAILFKNSALFCATHAAQAHEGEPEKCERGRFGNVARRQPDDDVICR